MTRDSLFQAFWFTQYISLVAISTLYVYRIQRNNRHALLYSGNAAKVGLDKVFSDLDEYFNKAKQCQSYLAEIVPAESSSRRHHKLLDSLKAKAEKESTSSARRPKPATVNPPEAPAQQLPTTSWSPAPPYSFNTNQGSLDALAAAMVAENATSSANMSMDGATPIVDGAGMEMFSSPDDSSVLQDLMGWESLDQLGFTDFGELYNVDSAEF